MKSIQERDRGATLAPSSGYLPLVFDLDGTLISTDILPESVLSYVRINIFRILVVLLWALRGRAYLKRRLADATQLDIARLPLREDVVAYARAAFEAGRPTYIASASDVRLVEKIAERLPFARAVFGSDGVVNLKSKAKARLLEERFPDGFGYVGDSKADMAVWAGAREAVYVGPSASLSRQLIALKGPVVWIRATRAGARDWAKALRLHQWAKNSLIFVPLLLGGKLHFVHAWLSCLLGFIGMGLLASSTYVLNDLMDLDDDRAHWSKKDRAFASGRIAIGLGVAIIPVGLCAGLAVGYGGGGGNAVLALCAYLTATLVYSFGCKRVPILDVAMLATLFTLRIAIGVVCAGVAWSAWLLVFSMFLFSSLSLAKRLSEINRVSARGGEKVGGRGYLTKDAPLVLALGVSLATTAIFVIVAYLIEEAFRQKFYGAPQFLWSLPVVLALWLGRIWLLCGRGELDDDPVVFAVRDRISLALGAFLAASVAAAVLL